MRFGFRFVQSTLRESEFWHPAGVESIPRGDFSRRRRPSIVRENRFCFLQFSERQKQGGEAIAMARQWGRALTVNSLHDGDRLSIGLASLRSVPGSSVKMAESVQCVTQLGASITPDVLCRVRSATVLSLRLLSPSESP